MDKMEFFVVERRATIHRFFNRDEVTKSPGMCALDITRCRRTKEGQLYVIVTSHCSSIYQ